MTAAPTPPAPVAAPAPTPAAQPEAAVHTPGPWFIRPADEWTTDDGRRVQWGRFDISAGNSDPQAADYYRIASVSNVNNAPQNEANAWLIADAPRLSAALTAAQARAEAAEADNAALRTVMVAAAEEIHAHWEAHCDAEGYGPQNLMRRLEEGIPSEYGYTAGAFAELRAQVERMREALAALCRVFPTDSDMREAGWSDEEVSAACNAYDAARAALSPQAQATPDDQPRAEWMSAP